MIRPSTTGFFGGFCAGDPLRPPAGGGQRKTLDHLSIFSDQDRFKVHSRGYSASLAADNVDPDQICNPRRRDIRSIRDFMVVFGLLSTAFDLVTFAVLLQIFGAGPVLFRSGWFIGATLTELAVLLVLRTRGPALRSRPGTALLVSSIAVAAVAVCLPYMPRLASPLGLEPPPASLLGILALITLAYVASAETIKRVFYRAAGSPRRWGSTGNRG